MSKLLSIIVSALAVATMLGNSASALSPNKTPEYLRLEGFSRTVKDVEPPKKTTHKTEDVQPAPVTPQVVTYTVVEGDNLTDIAAKYNSDWKRLYNKNVEIANENQLTVGQVLTVPSADEVLTERSVALSEAPTSGSSTITAQVTTSAPTASHSGSGGPNAYGYGWCTWWVKEKRPDIGSYWGNGGFGWLSAAQAAGYSTGSIPRAGAIGVMAGHVVYVESTDGSTVSISEMGWNYTQGSLNYRTVSASSFTYIY